MLDKFPFYLGLVIAIVLIIMLANKIKVAYPVLLVLAGLIIGFIPGIPSMHMDPEMIFFVFLPPLLYEASWAVSWKEMWKWRRIILSFAFVVVFLTALSVAFIANYFIPGFSLALGFLLGGIVSPPDAVSAGAILKFVKVPKRMSSILEGESLLNDASSLIIFRFALIAVATGQFVFATAALNFTWMLIGGVGIGLVIGWLFMKAHTKLPTDTNMDIVFSVVTPYIMYLAAEEAHSSGVLAVVSGGLFMCYHRHSYLSSSSRLRGFNVWDSFCFILNGLVFTMIGLALPGIIAGLGQVSIKSAIGYGVLITGVLIIARLLSAYGAVIVTLVARNFIKVADARNPGVRAPFLLGWTGMRGVVSLAAALSIPTTLGNGLPFPQRNLIQFITFIVILLTLLIQGLSLPFLIRKIGIPDFHDGPDEDDADAQLRGQLAQQALLHLRGKYPKELAEHPALRQMESRWESHSELAADEQLAEDAKAIYIDVLNHQRLWLIAKNNSDRSFNEDVVRRYFQQLDLEEEKLKMM